ncbi:hypothetical protein AB833_30460 [Chromatiales bacterium (ex Bugula neritina AB1)]|nr:hypothetical protein AB833_30460 [Chromatiales bacterium (ex Bugula neritina AB1)]
MNVVAELPVNDDGPKNNSIGHIADTDTGSSNDAEHATHTLNPGGLNSELANRWLLWQCRMIADVITGCVFDINGNVLATRPARGEGFSILSDAAMEARQADHSFIKTEVTFGPSNGRLGDTIATPIKANNKTLAYVAVLMAPRPQSRQNVVLQLLQWGGYWLESLSQLSDGVHQEAGSFTQSLLVAVLKHSNSRKACMEIANRLADRLSCDRVSIGLRQGLVVRAECISHLASFDPRTQLVRRLEAAMEESFDQKTVISAPQIKSTGACIDKAHRELLTHNGSSVVSTFPLTGQQQIFGSIVFERSTNNPFDSDTIRWCEAVLSSVAPVIELKRFEERSLRSKAADSLRSSLTDLVGPEYLKLKMAAVFVAAILFLGSIVNGTYEVSAPAQVEGSISRVIAAPIAGFVKSSSVRAGDLVKEGEILATLDDRSLQLELKKWQGEENKLKKAYQEALAKKARTELSILRAKADQIDAELALTYQRIERTQLRAPYNGYVASGDLSQSLGAPVEIGDVLFEVAPLENYRVVLEVDERDMAGVEKNNTGEVVIAALPSTPIPFTIDQVIPVAVSGEGNSYFRVEATIPDHTQELRPGMEGIARIDMGHRKLLWIWTHNLVDRIRLWLWSVGW